MSLNQFPRLHNAMWPGLVGKGPDSEPPIDLDTMLNLTAGAKVNGDKFEGIDIFLFDPHINIDSSDDDLKRLADKVRAKGLVIGSVVAPVWGPTGGGSAMGNPEERKKWVRELEKRLLDEEVHYAYGLTWYRIVPHSAKLRGWTITPSHFLNQQLDQVWLAD